MGHVERRDGKDVWHGVTNRGVGKRSIIEDLADARYFMSCVARVCRMGLIEVHAYALMQNHFHLLVRSPVGELSRAMKLIQNAYARWFNRRRKRDGPLFRGRFKSKVITSVVHWWASLRYVDHNPVHARIVKSPVDYPHGSARHYTRDDGRPLWLTRTVVEAAVMGALEVPYDPTRYPFAIGPSLTPQERELVERRLASPSSAPEEDPLDDLFQASPGSVKSWLRWKAANADGTEPGLPIVSAVTIDELVVARRVAVGEVVVRPRNRKLLAWPILTAGLLRQVCGCSLEEIRARTGASLSTARARASDHVLLLRNDEVYAEIAAEILSEAIGRDHAVAGRLPARAGARILGWCR